MSSPLARGGTDCGTGPDPRSWTQSRPVGNLAMSRLSQHCHPCTLSRPAFPGGCGRYVVLMSCQEGIAAELVVIEYGTFRFKVFRNLVKVECIISLHFMV